MSVEKRKPDPTQRSTKRPVPVNEGASAASAAVSNHKYVVLYYIEWLHLNDIGEFHNIYVSHHGIKTCIYFKWKTSQFMNTGCDTLSQKNKPTVAFDTQVL
jgi:hypothetical protein